MTQEQLTEQKDCNREVSHIEKDNHSKDESTDNNNQVDAGERTLKRAKHCMKSPNSQSNKQVRKKINTNIDPLPLTEKDPLPTNEKEVEKPDGNKRENICENVPLREPSCLVIPDPLEENVSPDAYLSRLMRAQYGITVKVRPSLELENYFPPVTEEQLSSYTMKIVAITRQNNVAELEKLHALHGSGYVGCVNRFGESLIHMACRRGFIKMVEFFLSDKVALDPRMRDDFGRTPLHDACWNPHPQLDILKLILKKDPSLFFVADKRGCTPFQYARPEDWPCWRQFLYDNRHHLKVLVDDRVIDHFT